MALVIGTNCGFVSTAPTADPAEFSQACDGFGYAVKDTTAASGETYITEIGWYCDNATSNTNFEVGLYDDDGGDPGTLLEVERTHAKGTTAGWKTASVAWNIESNTIYWIAFQLDNLASTTNTNRRGSGSDGYGYSQNISTLASTWNVTFTDSNGTCAIYALIGEAPTGTDTQINIGDSWKEISAMKVNVGDVWKDVSSMQINIGDSWKEIF